MRVATPNLTRWLATGITILIALALGATTALADGRCAIANVPEALVLPDGSVHAPGRLQVCLTKAYSPVQGLHRAYLDGQPTGLFLSRRGQGEGPDLDGKPYFLFRRDAAGRLELQAYAWPEGDVLRTYVVNEPAAFAAKRAARRAEHLARTGTADNTTLAADAANDNKESTAGSYHHTGELVVLLAGD